MEGQNPSGSFCTVFNKIKPYLAMVSLQFGYAGLHIVTKLCLKRGMNHYVLVVYRHAVATIVIAPFALLLERPVIDQNLYYVGLQYTTATLASALNNVLPAVTFIMAIIFRLEKLKIKKLSSQAKIVGTLLTVAGAMVMTVYRGPILNFVWTRGRSHLESTSSATEQNWMKGTLMLIGSCVGWSAFFIVQSFTLRSYPAELSLTTLICLAGMVEGAALALVMERGAAAAWSIGWDARLLAPVYSGIVCSGIAYYVQGVVIKKRGPVFVTAFSPLCMVIVAVLGSIILAEQIHLGRVIGAIIIVIGLYCVVWGKSKDPLESTPSIDEKKKALQLPTTMIESEKTASNDTVSGGIVKMDNPSECCLSLK